MKLSQYNVLKRTDSGILIMNTRSGGILSLNSFYSAEFEKMQAEDCYKTGELVEELKKGGMLVDDDRDEYQEIMTQSILERFSNTSLSLTIAPTMACNFCCPYCYEKGQKFTTMTEETINSLVKFIENNFPHISDLFIGWYGGEPLLAIEQIQEITDRLKKAIPSNCLYHASIVTNGYFLTPQISNILKKCDVSSAQITLDGSKKDHDSRRVPQDGSPTYERILQNVKESSDIIDISIRINVDKSNILAANELLLYLEKNGLKNKVHFYLAPVDDINNVCANSNMCFTIQEFSEEEIAFYESAISFGFKPAIHGGISLGICGAVEANSYVIDPLGDLYKCWDDIGRVERKVGTIFNPPMLTHNMMHWLNYFPNSIECKECFAFPMCMGGCPNVALHSSQKKCASMRYNAEKKLVLAQRMKNMGN